MVQFRKASIAALGIVALAGCTKAAPPASDTTASTTPPPAATATTPADEQAIRAINVAWFKAYNAHDVDGVTALYAEDAVLNIPSMPAARGTAAIKDAYQKDIGAATKAAYTNNQGAKDEIGVSGDVAWQWSTFTVTDRSGKTVDTGKYVTVFGKKNGKWMIIRDIWNSDGPPTA